jgi:hypothetical protein
VLTSRPPRLTMSHSPSARKLPRAGLVHGLGNLDASNSICDKLGVLSVAPEEREHVRLHPHPTQRMLHQSEALAPVGVIAVQLDERLDGSGYARGLAAVAVPPGRRIAAPPTDVCGDGAAGPCSRSIGCRFGATHRRAHGSRAARRERVSPVRMRSNVYLSSSTSRRGGSAMPVLIPVGTDFAPLDPGRLAAASAL